MTTDRGNWHRLVECGVKAFLKELKLTNTLKTQICILQIKIQHISTHKLDLCLMMKM